MGRPPSPIHELILKGTFRKDRHTRVPLAPVSEPVGEPVEPPPDLSRAERKYWDRFAPILAKSEPKLLTPAAAETFKDFCRASVALDEIAQRRRGALTQRRRDLQLVRMLDAQMRNWIKLRSQLITQLGLRDPLVAWPRARAAQSNKWADDLT